MDNGEKKERNTQQKKIILETVLGSREHPTADQIYELVHGMNPKVSRGTVYRNLKTLAMQGKIRPVMTLRGPERYDSNLSDHYHIQCERCGKIFDADMRYMDELDDIDEQSGCSVTGHRLMLTGLCPECRKKKI